MASSRLGRSLDWLLLSSFALVLVACGRPASEDRIFLTEAAYRDTYSPDLRRPATKEQSRWTVYVGGCTGSMLTHEYVLTANHCDPRVGASFTSGGCLFLGCKNDLKVAARTECSATHDYCVVKVTGSNKQALAEQRYTWRVMRDIKELKVGADTVATPLFTVGFPGDKNNVATYSPGFAKRADTATLMYNLGSINGNSGGAVWTSDTRTLVTMTNFGRKQLNQQGWNNNNPNNAAAWNGGGRMDVIYKQSTIFKKLFPAGRNLLVDSEGELLDLP